MSEVAKMPLIGSEPSMCVCVEKVGWEAKSDETLQKYRQLIH